MAIALLASGCAGSRETATPPAVLGVVSLDAVLETGEEIESLCQGVVLDGGLVVTANHCLGEVIEMWAVGPTGRVRVDILTARRHPGLASSGIGLPAGDVAVLSVQGDLSGGQIGPFDAGLWLLTLAESGDIAGDEVTLWADDDCHQVVGSFEDATMACIGEPADGRLPGSSGAPVIDVDDSGRAALVGVVSASLADERLVTLGLVDATDEWLTGG